MNFLIPASIAVVLLLLLLKFNGKIQSHRLYALGTLVIFLLLAWAEMSEVVRSEKFHPGGEAGIVAGTVLSLGALVFSFPFGNRKGERTPAYHVTLFVAISLGIAHVMLMSQSSDYVKHVKAIYQAAGHKV